MPRSTKRLGYEMRLLDVHLARAWRILGVIGIVGGLLVWKLFGFAEGPAIAFLSLLGVAWYTLHIAWLDSGYARSAVVVGTWVEALVPTLFMLAIALTHGVPDALGSYLPPMLFATVVVAGAARLRPKSALIVGATTAILYAVFFFGFFQPRLSATEAAIPLLAPGLQVTRSLAFAGGGVLTYLVTQALRAAIGRAERNVRSRDLFGKYRLGKKIGAGGMGVVHRALYCPEGGFERTVAVKLLHAHLADQPAFIDAFRDEAELSARLVHPNVVQVFDFGRIAGAYFLAMEYVDGVTLRVVQRALETRGVPTPPGLVAFVGLQILAGLEHAHVTAHDADGEHLRVVHRDLCPSNVLVSANGEVKISDFGVAKALRGASFSETKTVVGHAGYMAPEQLRAQAIDERCDLFAVGVMLWELSAGRSLFTRTTETQTMIALLEEAIDPITRVRADLAPGWDAFFERALARKPADRFATASEMAIALSPLAVVARASQDELASIVALHRPAEVSELGAEVDTLITPADLVPTRIMKIDA